MFIAHINNKGEQQSCKDHSLGTARIAKDRLSCINLGDAAFLAGVLHDAGKFTDEFNDYIKKAYNKEKVNKGSVIHTFTGCSYILNKYHKGDLGYEDITSEIIAYSIGAHHALFDCVNEDGDSGFDHRLFKQPEYDNRAINNVFNDCISSDDIDALFKSAILEIKDKIDCLFEADYGKNDSLVKIYYIGMLTRLLLSSVIDGDRIDTFNFMIGETKDLHNLLPDWETGINNLNKYLDSFEKNNEIEIARNELSNICADFSNNKPDIYELKLPTGAGKTLSSMKYAIKHLIKYKKKRIFYIAPLISILEQNSRVIKEALGNSVTVLEHHSSVVMEDDSNDVIEEEINKNTYQLLTDNWDSPIVITTLVQFLFTLFGGKTSQVRRFSSLVDSVIIIDEVQTVPRKMLSLFNLAINFLKLSCNATVILCSATQPSFDKLDINMLVSPYKFLTDEQEDYFSSVFKRSDISFGGSYKLEDMPSYIEEVLNNSDSLLVVCNKKKQAEYIYNKLNGCDASIYHLSASMCATHREDILKRIIDSLYNKEKVICVSTQVIEAGVDISFSTVIRFEAGLDSIIQSNGRCNRHGELEGVAHTYVVRCMDEDLTRLEDIRIAKNAMTELLEDFNENSSIYDNDLTSKKSISIFYDLLYRSYNIKKTYYYVSNIDNKLLYILSDNNKWASKKKHANNYFLNQAFKTAGFYFDPLDNDMVTLLVPYNEGEEIIVDLCSERAKYDILYAKRLIGKAKKYSVSLMRYQVKELKNKGAIYNIFSDSIMVLKKEYYDNNTGVIDGKEGVKECNILIL